MKKNILIFFTVCFSLLKVNAQTLWGTTYGGGTYDFGTIFSMPTGSSSITVQHTFFGYGGMDPDLNHLTKYGNKYYGTTSTGGLYGCGLVFSYDISSGAYTIVYQFNNTLGANPQGSLVLGPDGKLYGLVSGGASGGFGAIYRLDTLGNYQIIFQFATSANGTNPRGDLMWAANGKFYGLTAGGGANGFGTLFSVDTAGNYNVLYSFQSASSGAYPYGSLIQAANGLLYGMTSSGGVNHYGNIFSFDTATLSLTTLYSFSGSATDGGSPQGSLMQASNGKLYGMNYQGGAHNTGVIFSYNISLATYTTLYSFTASTGNPYGNLIQGRGVNLYGESTSGSAIFSFNISTNTFTLLHSLSSLEGISPYGSLVQESNGKLLGMAYSGGIASYGTLYECDTLGGFTKKFDFDYAPQGAQPGNNLYQGADGKLYGLTSAGGTNNQGVVFSIDPISSTYKVVYNFASATGYNPLGALIQDANGKFYGLTQLGGTNSGVLFSCDTAGNYADLYNCALASGYDPNGSLFKAANGKMYGMTQNGGSHGYGTIFSYKISTNTWTTLYSFLSDRNPLGTFMLANNGKMYGTTLNGGTGSDGAIFTYDTNGNYNRVFSFGGANGKSPGEKLCQASNGLLYGLTSFGGANNQGVIFSIDTSVTPTYNLLYSLSTASGYATEGALLQASNGKLYGLNYWGGANRWGNVFEYDMNLNTYTIKYNFTGYADGASPHASLIEIGVVTGNKSITENNEADVKVYPNPNNGHFTLVLSHAELVAASHPVVEIYNALGEKVYSNSFNTEHSAFNIRLEQPDGIYFFRVIKENGELIGSGKVILAK